MKFCSACGSQVKYRIPEGDDRLRYVCDDCGIVHYQNPKVVVGTIPYWQDKVLLCRRAIEPQLGLWTLPAGYMENGESSIAGAIRETYEEAGATLIDGQFYRLFDIPFINQVYLFYLSEMPSSYHCPGPESLESQLFTENEIPWDELAFPVIHDVLKEFFLDREEGQFRVRTGLPFHRASVKK